MLVLVLVAAPKVSGARAASTSELPIASDALAETYWAGELVMIILQRIFVTRGGPTLWQKFPA